MIDPLTQGHLLPMVTPVALLTRVGKVDFDCRSASFFRFAEQPLKKTRPRRVLDAFRQTMVLRHTMDVQIFHTDDPEPINDAATRLMREVVTPEADPFVNTRHDFPVVAPHV